jgi:CheY-like chemotaxis protein
MAKILIVDDVHATRETIREMLERGGYDVIEASNGKEGLKMIEEHAPNAVVTDILMPEMEGLETIKHIVKTRPDLPVIAITASIGSPYLEVALQFGAVSGLHKPFKQAELLSTVQKVLHKAEKS